MGDDPHSVGSSKRQHPACGVFGNTHISVTEQQPLPQQAPAVQQPDFAGQEETAIPPQLTNGPGWVGEVSEMTSWVNARRMHKEIRKLKDMMHDLKVLKNDLSELLRGMVAKGLPSPTTTSLILFS